MQTNQTIKNWLVSCEMQRDAIAKRQKFAPRVTIPGNSVYRRAADETLHFNQREMQR